MKAPDHWRQAGLVSTLLLPLSAVFRLGSWLRQRTATPYRAPVPVVCIGNLTAGGTGKTPVALSIAARLIHRGLSVHFLSRGYGGRLTGPLRVNAAGHTAADVGDEPLLLSRQAPTWIARDRAAGAKAAAEAGADLIVMDDGLQNPHLFKDLSLIVVDGAYGFGNGRIMPAGPLREPVADGVGRADAVVLMGPDETAAMQQLDANIPLLHAALKAQPDAALDGQAVVAFAGIGRPEKFFATLETLGCRIVERHAFADHHVYDAAEIDGLLSQAAAAKALPITTEKDWMRLSATHREKVRALPVSVEWRDSAALDALLERIDPPAET